MANDNPDGLELYLHMLHDLMQNKAEVNCVLKKQTPLFVLEVYFVNQERNQKRHPGVFGLQGDVEGIHSTL